MSTRHSKSVLWFVPTTVDRNGSDLAEYLPAFPFAQSFTNRVNFIIIQITVNIELLAGVDAAGPTRPRTGLN
jgi:hypothetical protein